MRKRKKISVKTKRAVKLPAPIPPLAGLSSLTVAEFTDGGVPGSWTDAYAADEFKHRLVHPVAAAIRQLRSDLAKLGAPERERPTEYFGDKEGYWEFQDCVKYGLNPYDFNIHELERLRWENYMRREKREAEEQRQAESPIPKSPEIAYRIVKLKKERLPSKAAVSQAPTLALHARYGKRRRPHANTANVVPVFEKYCKEPETSKPGSRGK